MFLIALNLKMFCFLNNNNFVIIFAKFEIPIIVKLRASAFFSERTYLAPGTIDIYLQRGFLQNIDQMQITNFLLNQTELLYQLSIV